MMSPSPSPDRTTTARKRPRTTSSSSSGSSSSSSSSSCTPSDAFSLSCVGKNSDSDFSPLGTSTPLGTSSLSLSLLSSAAGSLQADEQHVGGPPQPPPPPPPPRGIYLAPMVRGSELAMRTLARRNGASLCYGPMLRDCEVVEAYKLWRAQQEEEESSTSTEDTTNQPTELGRTVRLDKAGRLLHSVEETAYLLLTDRDDADDTLNLIVQLCGSNPAILADATTAILELYGNNGGPLPAGIDLNLGCPQECASRATFGAFLVERDAERAASCVQAMKSTIDTYWKKRCCDLGVTCRDGIRPRLSAKMRLLESTEETIVFCRRLQQAGCDCVAVHCRRRTDKHDGPPDWDAGRQIVRAIQTSSKTAGPGMPVILNGGIRDRSDAEKVTERTGCHAVMAAQGYLESHARLGLVDADRTTDNDVTPLKEDAINRDYAAVAALAIEYLDHATRFPPPCYLYLQKHLRWIFRSTLQPPTNVQKVDYSDWRVQLWGFLVRPYLRSIDQFRLVVALYCKLARVPTTGIPESIKDLVKDVSFKSIKKAVKGT